MEERNYTKDVTASQVFEPDLLLPSQHARRSGVRRNSTGEHRLMMAILEDAVDVYLKHAAAKTDAKRDLFVDAEAWIESEDATWIFSFESICHVLGIDPDCIRDGLRAHKTQVRGARATVLSLPLGSALPTEQLLRRVSA